MDKRTIARCTKNFNPAKQEFLALAVSRAREGLGMKFPELVSICGNARSVYRTLDELTAARWNFSKKLHADGSLFFWLVSSPSNEIFPTMHFRSEPMQPNRLMLADQPTVRNGF